METKDKYLIYCLKIKNKNKGHFEVIRLNLLEIPYFNKILQNITIEVSYKFLKLI